MGNKVAVRTGQTAGKVKTPAGSRARTCGPARRAQRTFTGDYKLAILAECDRCSEPGEKGALLRREGRYSSVITDWRR